MGKSSGISLAKRDDPIFKRGPTFFTRPSGRISTPSTPTSQPKRGKGSEPGSPEPAPEPTPEAEAE